MFWIEIYSIFMKKSFGYDIFSILVKIYGKDKKIQSVTTLYVLKKNQKSKFDDRLFLFK